MRLRFRAVRLVALVLLVGGRFSPGEAAAQECGNLTLETGEECDDGDAFGGDGCAANCTHEKDVVLGLQPVFQTLPEASRSVLQSVFLSIPATVRGTIHARVGAPRNQSVSNTRGETFAPGDVPIVLRKATSTVVAAVPGFFDCMRIFEAPELGPGNFGSGRIGCGTGLEDIDSTVEADSVTGASTTTVSGSGGRGSALLSVRLSNTFDISRFNGECSDTDPIQFPPMTLQFTTGAAEAVVRNANKQEGWLIASGSGAACPSFECAAPGEQCVQGTCGRSCGSDLCHSGGRGAPIDCDLLIQGSAEAFFDAALIGAGPVLGQPGIGDHTMYTAFVFYPTTTEPTPTRTQATSSPTATATPPPVTCVGDCDGDDHVTVDEILLGVNIALGNGSLDDCRSFDTNRDLTATVDELVRAVKGAPDACGS